jgi:hypothetical protein
MVCSQRSATVLVTVVTYRRPNLLRRALLSVKAQTYDGWRCQVVNDDPDDAEVAHVVRELSDPRIYLYEPVRRRGASGSFNLAFATSEFSFLSLLEDDNWWEPTFLADMLAALKAHPNAAVACANERVWTESSDGSWHDTGRTIWPESGPRLFWTTPESACGSATICNSSMLVRRIDGGPWLTPGDIPVDVTEHFRERILPQPILLVGKPLVNYAETLKTHRDTRGNLWSDYQCLLIGSIFASLPAAERRALAIRLLEPTGGHCTPRATALLSAGVAVPEARVLWGAASWRQRLRYLVTALRRTSARSGPRSALNRRSSHWHWLLNSPYNRALAAEVPAEHGNEQLSPSTSDRLATH